jgi:hypothetical protein
MAKLELIAKSIFPLFFCITLFSCTEKVTTYTPDEGEVQWIHLDKNFAKGVSFYIQVQKDTLAAVALAEIRTKFAELGYYKSIDIGFAGLEQDTVRMNVSLTDEKHNEELSFTGHHRETMVHQVKAIKIMDDTLSVVLTCKRIYTLPSLPAKLQLSYRIATQDTLVAGTVSFKAVETETTGVMRWH